MQFYLICALIAPIALGVGLSMMKYSVSTQLPPISLSNFMGDLKAFVVALLTSGSWLSAFGVMCIGATANGTAIALGPLSVVQPIYTLHILIVMIAGVKYLGEKLRLQEWLGGIIMMGGAVMLAFGPPPPTHGHVNQTALVAIFIAAVALSLLTVGLLKFFNSETAAERLLGILAGMVFGISIIGFKLAMLRAGDGGFAWENLADPILWLWLVFAGALQPVGIGVLNVAFAHGRASVVIPLKTFALTAYPVIGGFAVFGEAGGPMVFLGIGMMLAGMMLFLLANIGRGGATETETGPPDAEPEAAG